MTPETEEFFVGMSSNVAFFNLLGKGVSQGVFFVFFSLSYRAWFVWTLIVGIEKGDKLHPIFQPRELIQNYYLQILNDV